MEMVGQRFRAGEMFLLKGEKIKRCHDLLNERTIELMKTHQPKSLPEELVKELKKIEDSWLRQAGLKHYPKRE